MKIKSLLIAACTLGVISAQAQEKYRVVYDYNSDKISYYLIDKNNNIVDTLKNPKIKRDSHVELRLLNVNPFAVTVSTAVNEETLHTNSGQSGLNFGGLLGQIGGIGGDKLKLNIPSSTLQKGLINDAVGTRGESAVSRGSRAAQKIDELADITANVSSIKSTLLANLSNPNMDKASILKNLEEVTKQYGNDVRLPDPSANYYSYLTNMEKVVNMEKQAIVSEIQEIGHEVEASSVDKPLSRGEMENQNKVLKNLSATVANVESASNTAVNNLNEIKSLYAALEASSFEQVYDYKLGADKMNIDLKFQPSALNNTAATNAPNQVLKERKLSIRSKGGFKINTSIALTMNNFGKKSNDYFINAEGIVGSEANNYFVPNLSTMINFYPMLSDSFNLGGSFGLSMPISDNVNGVNFLLGPSLFLGNKNRLSLSGGVAYGPMDRLTKGLEVGQSTSLRNLDGYTKKVYDFGYYFGISFSLFDIN